MSNNFGSPLSGGSSSSSSVSWSGATKITSAGTYSSKTYTSSTADENAVLVSLASGTVNLVNPTVTKSGDSDGGDNCNFYGINSAVMAMGGGNTVAKNLTITTTGQSSAPIRTDRGSGYVTVTGGSYTSSGLGSPAIYSTADIVVESATLTSNLSEGVCIEGKNSVALTDCTLTASNTSTNGQAQFLDAIMIYQSMSGDADSGTSTFSMTGGVLNNTSGHLFHVTNTSAIISLSGVTINDSGDGVLLSVCDDGWSGASNIATLNASGQELTGDILVGSDSTLTLNISDSSTFTGNLSGSITNASGTSKSTSLGTVNVSLDSSSKWYLTGDTYVTSFEGTAANVITNGYTLYENGTALDGTTTTEEDSKEITLTTGNDTLGNTIAGATIQALAGNDSIRNYAAATSVSIIAGKGNDTIRNYGDSSTIEGTSGKNYLWNRADYVSVIGGTSKDTIKNTSNGNYVTISGGNGADDIDNDGSKVTIYGGAGADDIDNEGSRVSISGDAGNDGIDNEGSRVTIDGGAGADDIDNEGSRVSINAGDGADTIKNSASTVTILGGAGNDYIVNTGTGVTIDGGADDDTLLGSSNSDTLYGDAGNDSIVGKAGDDKLYGNDSLNGGSNADTLSGGSGKDTLLGGTGNDSLRGGTGNDSLWGGTGNDIYYYAQGDGKDVIYGFEDGDTLTLDNLTFTSSYSTTTGALTLTVDGGSITLKEISATTFNINDKTYTLNSKKTKLTTA